MQRFKWLAIVLAVTLVAGFAPVGNGVASAAGETPQWDNALLAQAADASPRSMQVGYNWSTALDVSEAMYLLALAAYYDPDITVSGRKYSGTIAERVVDHLEKITEPYGAPSCRGALGGWVDNPVAQAMVLAKHTPVVWNQLDESVIEKLDFIMSAMAVVGNYTQNYENDPCSDLSQDYWWHKGWNPNHQEGYVGVMIAANLYFGGADAVNQILADFDYDTYIAKMDEYQYVNRILDPEDPTNFRKNNLDSMKYYFESTGKELLENGGRDRNSEGEAGTLVGAKIPFTYQSNAGPREDQRIEYEPLELYKALAYHMYGKTVISEYYQNGTKIGYIVDGSKSPYEGLMGMGTEFSSGDAGGVRTDAGYINSGWRNSVPTRATLEALGVWDSAQMAEIESIMYVGTEDFLYKVDPAHGGYLGYQKGHVSGPTVEEDFESQGFPYYKQVWVKLLKKDGIGFEPKLTKSGNTLSATLNGYNLSLSAGKDLTAILAIYDGDRLVDIQTQVCNVPKLTGYSSNKPIFNRSINLASSNYKAKLFVWDSLDGMQPLTEEVSYGF